MAQSRYTRRNQSETNNQIDLIAQELGNVTPSATDLEEAVLGSLILDFGGSSDCLDSLSEECFHDPRCKELFLGIKGMQAKKLPIDYLTVTDYLKTMGTLDKSGGPAYLAGLSQKIGSSINLEYYTKILQQKMIQRNLIRASYNILRGAFSPTANIDELISVSQTSIFKATDVCIKKDTLHIRDVVGRTADKIAKAQNQSGLTGIPSGYESLDKITMGWQKGNLIIIGARPSVGKTAFALNLARNASVVHGHPVAFFSLEMQDVELVQRLVITESGLSASKATGRHKMDDQDWNAMEKALSRLSNAEIYLDETSSLPIGEFSSKAKNLVRTKGVELIVVDYLQLMKGETSDRAVREQEVASVSRALKGLAKELDIPIIALSQLSRTSLNRAGSNGRPQLGDLRESGSIEQDADMVMFLHRPEAMGLGFESEDHNTELIIAKHRNGELATIPLQFEGDRSRFCEVSQLWSGTATPAPNPSNNEVTYHQSAMNEFANGMQDFESNITSYNPYSTE